MYSRRSVLALAFYLSANGLGGCMVGNNMHQDQGGGSETTVSSLAGRVVDRDGKSIANAAIHLHSLNALPNSLLGEGPGSEMNEPVAYSKSDGSYLLKDVSPGAYFLECRGDNKTAALVTANLPDADTVLHLPDAILQPTGVIRGSIQRAAFDTANDSPMHSIYVALSGLGKTQVTDLEKGYQFQLTDIPAGTYELDIRPAYPISLAMWGALKIREHVPAGDTVTLDSLVLPLRAEIKTHEYSRDSLAVISIFKPNMDSTLSDSNLVAHHSAVLDGRIHMLYNLSGQDFRLSERIQDLDSLVYLNFLGSDWGHSFTVDEGLPLMPRIKLLKLDQFKFDVFPEWLNQFPSLITLQLSTANLSSLSPTLFKLVQLRTLDLARNNLDSLSAAIAQLRFLRVLNISNNGLTSIPHELTEMKSLRGVNLRGNRLCHLGEIEKAWVSKQDSLFWEQNDPLTGNPGGLSWDKTQECN
jgi:hypothetical protein